ncbi:aldose epimerase family protein [Fusobacterium polymorphum]|uniref:Aldose 1-epimerase n=1 Tax=Fusobacterium nucleatum subsp. polymorphum TaxID=76857 RepID=A0AAC8ZZZ1_FUSNP|nr:aldose epimerase family protein [Fusobacterium polymorphum]ALM94735.1 aldose epimerase [Fusobacterium polymorphum]ALQ43157.1 galactose mutarotase [Fusobacterium polymorphum]QYR59400.1 galactose mutarotase [Fusobacterium polymorphum]
MEEIKIYTLENKFLKVEFLNLGAIIKKIEFKDKNIVLGYEDIEKYRENPAYLGAVIGRTAGRIKDGLLKLDNTEYQLDKNNNGNTLHGGKNSISHRFLNVQNIENGLCFSIKSSDLDNGYPANVEIKVSYILSKNELLIKYFATTDNLTYLNLTNHSYFNLSGNPDNTIYEDILKIDSDYLIGINENSIPCETINLDNSIFNFKEAKKLEEFFKADDKQKTIANNGIDHPYIFNEKIGKLEIKNIKSGIKMSVETNNPAVVIYTANYLQDIGFKKHSAICFETQEVPNLYRDKNINVYPTFIDENTNYEKYTKFIFENIN